MKHVFVTIAFVLFNLNSESFANCSLIDGNRDLAYSFTKAQLDIRVIEDVGITPVNLTINFGKSFKLEFSSIDVVKGSNNKKWIDETSDSEYVLTLQKIYLDVYGDLIDYKTNIYLKEDTSTPFLQLHCRYAVAKF